MTLLRSTFGFLLALLGASFVMAGWSENYFFNEGPADALLTALATAPENAVLSQIEIGLFYTLPAAIALAAMAWRGASGLGRAMLVAALTGIAIEGLLVPAVYEAVPFSYLWTSIAWHGPVTVGLGIFLMPRLLARASAPVMAAAAVLAGLFWGVWTTWVWEAGVPYLSADEFAIFAAWTYAGIAAGYLMLHFSGWPHVTLPRPVIWLFAAIGLFFFVVQGLVFPIGAAGLAVIVAGLLWMLSRWPAATPDAEPMRWRNFAILFLMPLVAVATYGIQVEQGAFIPQEELISLTAASGLLVWLGCLWAGYRRAKRRPETLMPAG